MAPKRDPKLDDRDAEIYRLFKNEKLSKSEISRRFKLDDSYVGRIIKNIEWREQEEQWKREGLL